AGFVDPDPTAVGEAGEEEGVPGFQDLDEALARTRPDVVHVCTPPRFHGSVALRALEAGANLYVEKPFTLEVDEARTILSAARERGLLVAAGHQLLMDPATLAGRDYFDGLGEIRHVESYFAFKPRREVSGRRPRTPVEQLLDILPHPTYLLADFLERGTGEAPEIRWLDASERGWAQVSVSSGSATGSLYVTLEGRPVNSFVRIVGSRGTLYLDYVRGIAIPKLWQGSGLDKVMEPYHEGTRLTWGSTVSLGRRVLKRERSYPGLRPMFEALYTAIRAGGASPVTPGNILFSVDLVEQVANRIEEARRSYLPPKDPATVAVSGGSGFLGRQVVASLLEEGEVPLVLGRRLPPEHERIPGAHYAVCDLADPDSLDLPPTLRAVVHCAAETAGSWDAHQRNSIDATRHFMEAAAAVGVTRFLHVSSLGVVSLGAREPISEDDPVEADPKSRGPYVWGKLASEELVRSLGRELGLETRVVRPGPLMDPEVGPPPGRLGRAAGPFFVAVGPRRGPVPTTDVKMAGRVLAAAAAGRVDLPEVLHLLDPEPLTRRQLAADERRRRPGARVVWLPWIGIRLLSALAVGAQKVLRPGKETIRVASAFAAPRYETRRVTEVLARVREAPRLTSAASN
ncbi:MAG TPA: NAD-dependent epimerase/dehydratase family protein, partial [Longimicrobiales bacterium]|nr:NAD-dependent epimerase/dehydratase family protein [Longimicrobiales bacterium]